MAIIMMGLMIGTIGMISGAGMKIYPIADAYVQNRNTADKNTNYGSCVTNPSYCQDLRVGYNINYGTDISYLKFDLNNLSGKTVNSAVLSIFGHTDPISSVSLNMNLVTAGWAENTITWNNKPSNGSLMISKSISSSYTGRVNFTINSSYLNGSQLSFALIATNSEDVKFYSREYNDEPYRPYLYVDYTGTGISCNTTADTSSDGKVSMSELLSYISQWKSGSVGMGNLLNAIGYWKAGVGC